MRLNKILFVAAAAAMLAGGPVLAAPVSIPAPDAPFINLSAGVMYHSNVAGTSAAFTSARGLTRSDEIFSPAAAINYSKQLGLITLFTQGTVGYDFYANNTILNRERIGVLGGASVQMDGCQLTGRGTYMRRQSDLEDLNFGIIDNTEEDIIAGADVTCTGFGRLVPSVSVDQTWANNSNNTRLSSDYETFAVSGSLMYQAGSFGDISLIGQYLDADFQNRLIPVSGAFQNDGYHLYSGGLRYHRELGAFFDMAVSLSQTSLDYGGVGQNFSGLTYDASLSYHPDSRLQLTAYFARQTNASNRLGAAYSIDQILQGDASYRLSSRLKAGLGISNKHQNFRGEDLIFATDISKQSVTSFYGSLGFNITSRMNLAFVARNVQRHADLAAYSYADNQLGLTLSQAF
ncbi:MAG TPA: hypothetical protein VGM68_13685 [Rhizomicrobium sp.]